jgi:hypothetical protein
MGFANVFGITAIDKNFHGKEAIRPHDGNNPEMKLFPNRNWAVGPR